MFSRKGVTSITSNSAHPMVGHTAGWLRTFDAKEENDMKNEIVKMIEKGNVSFAELGRIPGFKGEEALGRPEFNIVWWVGVSPEAIAAIRELMIEGIIEATPTSLLSYFIDGTTLNLRLAEDVVWYDETRWVPLLFNKVL